MTDEGRRLSERAMMLEARIREVQSSTTKVQEEQQEEIDKLLVGYLDDVRDEDDSKIQNIREIAKRAGIDIGSIGPSGTIPSPPPPPEGFDMDDQDEPATLPSPPPRAQGTRPAVTRPSPEVLADSRAEPDSKFERDYRVPLSPQEGPTSTGRVLVVDDDPAIRGIIEEVLRDAGYRVCAAQDGKEGLKRLFQMAPELDVILLDLMMPGMSGYEFLEIFDETPYSYIPVVIISANLPKSGELNAGDRFVFIGEKPRDAMKKPFYLEGFQETMARKVREGRSRRPRS